MTRWTFEHTVTVLISAIICEGRQNAEDDGALNANRDPSHRLVTGAGSEPQLVPLFLYCMTVVCRAIHSRFLLKRPLPQQ